jgi:hypothetical protein
MRQIADTFKQKGQVQSQLKENPPGPLIKKNLLRNSLSSDFEFARQEWEYFACIPSDSDDFIQNCQLCNSYLKTQNWVIENPNTTQRLHVGSECIKRFIILNGTESTSDTIRFLDNKQKEFKMEQELITLFDIVINKPLPFRRQANNFRRKLIKLLEIRGQKPLMNSQKGTSDILTSLLRIKQPTLTQLDKLYELLNYPKQFVSQPEDKTWRDFKFKEGETWRRSKKVTGTTLSGSGAYKPDARY